MSWNAYFLIVLSFCFWFHHLVSNSYFLLDYLDFKLTSAKVWKLQNMADHVSYQRFAMNFELILAMSEPLVSISQSSSWTWLSNLLASWVLLEMISIRPPWVWSALFAFCLLVILNVCFLTLISCEFQFLRMYWSRPSWIVPAYPICSLDFLYLPSWDPWLRLSLNSLCFHQEVFWFVTSIYQLLPGAAAQLIPSRFLLFNT